MRFSQFLMRHVLLRYALAIAAVPVAILLRYLLVPVIGYGAEYITVFPAMLVVAVLAGGGPAMLTAALGATVGAILFKPVHDARIIADVAILVATAALAGWLVSRLRSALAVAEEKSRDLAQSELFYRQTLESIPGMVFTTHPDGYCDFLSRQWADYTGAPMSEHMGEGWSNLLHPEDRERVLGVWRAAVQGLAPYDIEYRVRRHDGHYEWFKARGRPIRDADGRVVRWFGVAVNIDVFRRAQEQLIRLKNAQEEQTKELQSIISIVSHDLRAPLLNIRGFGDVLDADCRTIRKLLASVDTPAELAAELDAVVDESIPEALHFIGAGAKAMHDLVESLVKVARAGLVVPRPQRLEMNRLIRNVVASIKIKFQDTGARVDVGHLPPCYADRMHVTQVFTNLIDNALKYLDPERQGHICIEGTIEKSHALYWVSDNGVGIDPEHEARVFDIFYRVSGKTEGGEGIGLSVVKRMLERNDGRIWLVSEKGVGSNFFVSLPLPPDYAPAHADKTREVPQTT